MEPYLVMRSVVATAALNNAPPCYLAKITVTFFSSTPLKSQSGLLSLACQMRFRYNQH